MLGGADQIQILALYLVHHGIHLGEAHDARYDLGTDHKRRYHICEASAYHEVPRICDYCLVKSREITHQIVKSVAGDLACAVQIYAVETLHDLRMVRYLEIGNHRLAELLYLYILGIVLAYRNRRINDVRNDHHILFDFLLQLSLQRLQFCKPCCYLCNSRLGSLCLVLHALGHELTYLLADPVLLGSEIVRLGLRLTRLGIQLDHLIDQRELLILKLISDILLYYLGIFPHKSYIQHYAFPPSIAVYNA